MTEPQDVLAEALRPLLAWAEAVSQHHAMLRTEPPFTTTQALKEALASAYAALVRTPETLDVRKVLGKAKLRIAALPAGPATVPDPRLLVSSLDVLDILTDIQESFPPSERDVTGDPEADADQFIANMTAAATQSPTPPEGLRAAVALIAADWFDTGYENGRLDHGVLADRLFAALAASPAPDPGAMREALERIEQLTRPYPLAETGWPQRYPPIAATEEAHAVAVAALTPAAEPPETETT